MVKIKYFISIIVILFILVGCSNPPANECPITEPIWMKPPDDSAVSNQPVFGYYYANKDQSILTSAWWEEQDINYLRVHEGRLKMGWFRPDGAELHITGRRLDGDAPPLESHVPCCYPTKFQATSLEFPTEGCWEVTATADESILTFIVSVAP